LTTCRLSNTCTKRLIMKHTSTLSKQYPMQGI